MMNRWLRTPKPLGWSVMVAVLLMTTLTYGDDLKARMKARLAEIDKLKAEGVIGETHEGYLDFVGSRREGADIVTAENADRKKLYSAVAKKTNVDVGLVGSRAGLKWKNELRGGEYFKESDGKWIRKK